MAKQSQKRRARRRRRFILVYSVFFGLLMASLIFLFQLLCSGTNANPEQSASRKEASREETVSERKSEDGTSSSGFPEGWKLLSLPEAARTEGNLVLVNASHSIDAAKAQTVSVYEHKTGSYLVKDVYLSVTPETMQALNDWMDAFAKETGITDINIVSGWRSFADQTAIYDNAVATRGQAHADAYIALPGHSEHHTALAVDLDTYNVGTGTSGGFDGNGAYAWVVQHAWEYGFIQRYPIQKSDVTGIDFESWHFRYVGLPHAYVMQTENLCLEEYIDFLRNYPFSGEHLFVTCLGVRYELYFCAGDQVAVPTTGSYTISGNNVDGFIVTVEKP